MLLKELNIVNFKNIGEATLNFIAGFNCFVGKNGVGKTNILDRSESTRLNSSH